LRETKTKKQKQQKKNISVFFTAIYLGILIVFIWIKKKCVFIKKNVQCCQTMFILKAMETNIVCVTMEL